MKWLYLTVALLLAVTMSSQGFVLNYVSSTNYRHWSLINLNTSVPTNSVNRTTHAVRYYLASDGFSATNTAAELNALRDSFGQWLAVTNTHLKFEEVGLVAPPVDVNTSDNTNILYWAKSSTIVKGGTANISGALGVTYLSFFGDGSFSQGDIVFNGVESSWFTSATNTASTDYFIEGVALHEIGHFIGLQHSPVGGATMLFAADDGISLQAGLSPDDIAGARFIYPVNATNYGTIKGTITRSGGSAVFGAAVYVQNGSTNIVAGAMSLSNGNYEVSALLPGNYYVRVAPLDPINAPDFLATGNQIDSTTFSAADAFFLPTTNVASTVVANITNTVNFTVVSNAPAFRITKIRHATANANSYAWSSLGDSLRVGQSNYTLGVASANLPSSGATLTITGNGLTVGATTFDANAFGTGLNFMSVPISVSSNSTPGLRSFVVTQGANRSAGRQYASR